MALVASSASRMTPRPAEPTVLPQEGPGPRRGRWLFAMMVAVKAARLLHHGLTEPIAGRGRLCWCPGRPWQLCRAHLWLGGDFNFRVNGRRLILECKILTQVSTLSYLNINFHLSNIWHVIYQNVGNFLSFLEYLIRIGLRSYLGGVFS